MTPGILFPAPPHNEIDRLIRSQYQIWRVEYGAAQAKFEIENVRFEHDPQWRDHIWSITNAREQRSFVWKATGILFNVGNAAFTAALLGGNLPLSIAITFGLVEFPMIVKWYRQDKHD